MALQIGTRLGPYEIITAIGAGGMGEVYRARDTKLDRDVAIKILPELFAADPERVARFVREAKTLAALNHPHIAAIYGLEEAHGIRALVMELVEGPTLADRISGVGGAAAPHVRGAGLSGQSPQQNVRGAGPSGLPVPLDEALTIAKQIAEALEAAHEHGIIHRDLKPANIKVKDDGTVKVLDFGLAKALDPAGGATGAGAIGDSPTITSPAAMTHQGVILGTAAYMPPEQAKGRAVDKRADIWAFGCVLFEMLTGKRAFDGEDVTDTLVSVLSKEPAWDALPATSSPVIRKLLRRCLEKDRKRRLDSIADARLEVEDALAGISDATVPLAAPVGRSSWRLGAVLVLTALAGVAVGVALTWNLKRPNGTTAAMRVSRFAVTLPPGDELDSADPCSLALSPDGAQLAYVARRGGGDRMMFLRAIDSLEGKPLAGTEGAESPFFSPDGRWIGFFAGGKLKKTPASGGAPVVVCDAAGNLGGAWARNDVIFFADAGTNPIWQVAANGGRPKPFTTLDREKGEISHRWPQVLPGGAAVLFTVWTGPGNDEKQVHLQTLKAERRVLVRGGHTGVYVSTGHLVYYRRGTLMVVPFDLGRLEATDRPPVVVGEGVGASGEGADYAVSDAGVFAWVPGGPSNYDRTLVWVDRSGRVDTLPIQARAYSNPRLSPDGQRVAVSVLEAQADLWVLDLVRGVGSRLPADGSSQALLWTPDGQRLTYRATRRGTRNIFWRMADGSGTEERLTTGEGVATPGGWSPDGVTLVYAEFSPATTDDVRILDRRDRQARPFVQTRFSDRSPRFSPDGRWLAYVSNESGRGEAYVQPYPGGGARWQLSADGGVEPVWNPNGRELFYCSLDGTRMIAVPLVTTPSFSAGKPTRLFEGRFRTGTTGVANYDVSPDGQRFLMVEGSDDAVAPRQINVALNWFEELKRLAPAGR